MIHRPRNHFVFSCFRGVLAVGFAVTAACTPVPATDKTPAQGSSLPASILEPYLTIEEALVKDDIAPVRQNAGALATAATSLGAPAMKIQTGAAQLASADTVETAREKFGILSDAIVTYMDGNKLTGGDGVKIAYCPMMKKPWMQKGDALANPYYGASSGMATCGNFR
jgi:Protein of unknown function (DUF3347)